MAILSSPGDRNEIAGIRFFSCDEDGLFHFLSGATNCEPLVSSAPPTQLDWDPSTRHHHQVGRQKYWVNVFFVASLEFPLFLIKSPTEFRLDCGNGREIYTSEIPLLVDMIYISKVSLKSQHHFEFPRIFLVPTKLQISVLIIGIDKSKKNLCFIAIYS